MGKRSKSKKVKEVITITSREEWGALPPKVTPEPMKLPVKKAIFTYDTGVEPCTNKEDCVKALQLLQKRYMDELGLDDIPYNFLIGEDGHVYEGRGWDYQSDKTLQRHKLHSRRRMDVAFIGNYKIVPLERCKTAYDLMFYGMRRGYVHDDYEYLQILNNKIK